MGVNKEINKLIGLGQVVTEEDKKMLFKIKEEWNKDISEEPSILDELEPEKREIILKTTLDSSSKYSFARTFIENIPLYYDRERLWWAWNLSRKCWEIIDEVDILNLIKRVSFQNTIKSNERTELLNALMQYARENEPKPAKKTWLQFDGIVVDYETGERFEASSEYFITNPIPWKLGKNDKTPTMDRIFKEWVGEQYVNTLYEIIAFSLSTEYFLERIFAFLGGGSNGKSCYLALIRKFLGAKNCVTTDLNLLVSSRFETSKLRDKLVCLMAETDFNELNNTQLIKRMVSGKDTIPIEYKNKGCLDYINYSKVLIATNNLPDSTDKTIGFYRRWVIIDFPNQFDEKKDILAEIPDEEYSNLALKSIEILLQLKRKREFTNEGNFEDRKKRYEDRSNPFDKFFKENLIEEYNSFITKNQFKVKLTQWCIENHFREMSDISILKHMKERGIHEGRPSMKWYDEDGIQNEKQVRAWVGIKFKEASK